MKITKKRILNELKDLIKKDGVPSKKLLDILNRLQTLQPKEKEYIYTVRGSGRHSHTSENLPSFKRVVTTLMGGKVFKNDAPRRGMLGEYVSFNKTELEILKKRINYILENKKEQNN
jgi:hypothetical protein